MIIRTIKVSNRRWCLHHNPGYSLVRGGLAARIAVALNRAAEAPEAALPAGGLRGCPSAERTSQRGSERQPQRALEQLPESRRRAERQHFKTAFKDRLSSSDFIDSRKVEINQEK